MRSLSLKYRPAKFNEIIGQEATARTLAQAAASGKIHQAYLFHGPRGSGKTSMARILAKILNCSGPKKESGLFPVEPCDVCGSCQDIAEGRSLDVLEIDAASHTGVEHVREVILDTINLAPARDPYRVFIIDEVHMLSTSAFNAMLKTLEEPPGHVVFILATTELAKVPVTVVSRTQSFPFRALSLEAIKNQLMAIAGKEGIVIEKTALEAMARQASGSLRDAISLLEQLASLAPPQEAITYAMLVDLLGFVEEKTLGCLIDVFVNNADVDRARAIVHEALYTHGYAPSRLLTCLYGECSRQLLENLGTSHPQAYAHRLYKFNRHLSSLLSEIRASSDPLVFCEVELLGYLLDNENQAPLEKIEPQSPSEIPETADQEVVKEPILKVGDWQMRFQEFLQSSAKEAWGFYLEGSRLTLKSEGPPGFQLEFLNAFNLKGVQKHESDIRASWRQFFGGALLEFEVREQQAPVSSSTPTPVGAEEIPEDVKKIAELFGGKIKKIR